MRFVTLLALSEVLTTAIFLKPLRTDMLLLGYFVGGVIVTVVALRMIANRRERIFNLPDVNLEASLHADRLDVSDAFHTQEVRP